MRPKAQQLWSDAKNLALCVECDFNRAYLRSELGPHGASDGSSQDASELWVAEPGSISRLWHPWIERRLDTKGFRLRAASSRAGAFVRFRFRLACAPRSAGGSACQRV